MKTMIKHTWKYTVVFLLMLIITNIFYMKDTSLENNNKEVVIKTASSIILPTVPKVIAVDTTTQIDEDVKTENENLSTNVIKTYYGNISYYGPDCNGCSGKTASGYDVSNGNIYYNDKEYGLVRIVASDASIAFGTIVKMDLGEEDMMAIVLDRGGIGFGKKFLFDVLIGSEKESYEIGINKNVKIDVLRNGF